MFIGYLVWKLFRRLLLALAVSFLLGLSIVPVRAAPSLSLGSTASYGLTGNIGINQDCTASPALYTSQACYGTSPPSNGYVTIMDDGHCSSQSFNSSVGCRWIPPD